jgi:hypothetical protein
MAKTQDIAAWVVGEAQIEWVTLRRGSDAPDQVERKLIPLNPAVAGEADPMPGQLKELAGSFKGDWIVAPSAADVLMRVLRMPAVDDSELASMVALQIDKISPFPVETMVVSHEILKREESQLLVLVAAVKTEKILPLQALFSKQGITPVRIDAPLAGWWEAIRNEPVMKDIPGRLLHIIMDTPFPHILSSEHGTPLLLRSLPECMGLEADDVLYELLQALRQTVTSLELEHGAAETGQIILWHGGDAPADLAHSVQGALGLPLLLQALPAQAGPGLGIVRRSADGQSTKLDLTSSAWRDAHRSKNFKGLVRNVLIGIVGVWLLFIATLAVGLFVQKHQLSALQKEKAELEGPSAVVKNMRSRVLMVKKYLSQGQSSLECLRQVSLLQPEGIDLLSFTYNRSEGVNISCEASGAAQMVYDFKEKLDTSGFFGPSRLEGPTLNAQTQKQLFQIELKLPQEAAP